MRVTVAAHAKINLDLRVLARRDDGYHALRTVFQELALHDTVTVEPRPGPFALAGAADRMPLGPANLAWQAAVRLWNASGRRGEPRGVRVTIRKRIPAQAGLGGGSSDAAATLVALDRLWGTRLGARDLHGIAAALGADVPFFLVGGTALGLGRGDELYPLVDLPPTPVVLAVPPFGVSTADAYAWLAADRDRARRPGRSAPARRGGAREGGLLPWGPNDLARPVEARRREIGRIRRALTVEGAWLASMSGSGSAVFGLFQTRSAAVRAARRLARPGWTVLVTRTRRRGQDARRRLREAGV